MSKRIIATSWDAFNYICQDRNITDDTVKDWKNQAFIEVQAEGDIESCPFYFKKEHPNVMQLLFDDCDDDLEYTKIGGTDKFYLKVITDEQAKQLAEFIKTNIDKNFLIHCHAGVSRSGAIAQYICELKDIPLTEFQIMNPYAHPNRRVLSKLRNQLSD